MKRSLDSYSKRVLIAWIERRDFSYFQEELDAIEAGLKEADRKPERQYSCGFCKDGGVIFHREGSSCLDMWRTVASWCSCAAALQVKRKVPDFVEVWNVHQTTGKWISHVKRMDDLQRAGAIPMPRAEADAKA